MPCIKNAFVLVALLSTFVFAGPPEFSYQGDKLILTFHDFDRISSTILPGYLTFDFSNFKKFHVNKNRIEAIDETMNNITVQIALSSEIEMEKDKKFKTLVLFFPYSSQKSGVYGLIRRR